MRAERHLAALFVRRKQDAPAVFGHLHIVELGPALRIDRHRGAQVHQRLLEALRPHVLPPVDVARVPAFERLEHAAVLGEVDVVRDFLAIIHLDDVVHRPLLYTRFMSNTAFWPVP
jgi:hypothetical protein